MSTSEFKTGREDRGLRKTKPTVRTRYGRGVTTVRQGPCPKDPFLYREYLSTLGSTVLVWSRTVNQVMNVQYFYSFDFLSLPFYC